MSSQTFSWYGYEIIPESGVSITWDLEERKHFKALPAPGSSQRITPTQGENLLFERARHPGRRNAPLIWLLRYGDETFAVDDRVVSQLHKDLAE